MADPRLKCALENGEFVLAPGVYDMISALMADRLNFQALYITGYGVSASHMGLPDVGLTSYSDMLSRIETIAKGTNTPIIADGDTGYGGLLNMRHTVQGYENAGVTAIQIEDQEFPKKCGHMPGRRVIGAEEMADKIMVAHDSRTSPDFLIIARTDSRTTLGLDEALRRADIFDEAGADVIFVESPESVEELHQIADHCSKPLIANMVPGGMTPVLPADQLKEIGFLMAIHPGAGFLSASQALHNAYSELLEQGNITQVPLHDFGEFGQIFGFEDILEFDKKWIGSQSRAAE